MPGDTQYREIAPGVAAPMVSSPGGPVRQDVQAAGAGFAALSQLAGAGVEYIDSLQKAADLNTVAQKRTEWAQKKGAAYADFAQSATGENPKEDMQRWGELSKRIDEDILGNVNPNVGRALGMYISQHQETYDSKVREAMWKTAKQRSEMTLDAHQADKLSLAMQTPNNFEREQYLAQQHVLTDAQVAAGLMSPIDGELRKVKDRRQFYATLFESELVKPTWQQAYNEWNNDTPIDSQGRTWKQLVGADGVKALERMTTAIFDSRTREANRLAEKREADGIRDINTRLAAKGALIARTATDDQWDAYKREVEMNPYSTPELIRSVQTRPDALNASPATRAAKAEVEAIFHGQKDYDGTLERRKQEALRELRDAVSGGGPIEEAKSEVIRKRQLENQRPGGFQGDPTPANLDAFKQSVLQKVSSGYYKQAQADALIERATRWVESMKTLSRK